MNLNLHIERKERKAKAFYKLFLQLVISHVTQSLPEYAALLLVLHNGGNQLLSPLLFKCLIMVGFQVYRIRIMRLTSKLHRLRQVMSPIGTLLRDMIFPIVKSPIYLCCFILKMSATRNFIRDLSLIIFLSLLEVDPRPFKLVLSLRPL